MIKNFSFWVQQEENQVLISVNPKIYFLEAIYGASFVFLDKAFIKLDGDITKEVKIFFKAKEQLTKKELHNLAGDFLNELLNFVLRITISKENKVLREYIVIQALISAGNDFVQEKSLKMIQKNTQEKFDDLNSDPRGIAIPWEEKYNKKLNNSKKK